MTRLVVLAPRGGSCGVGDHADAFLDAVRPQVGSVIELRHGSPGTDGVLAVWAYRRRLSALLRQDRSSTVVHAELAGGSVASFWALAGRSGVRRTATVHDAPRPVWFPFLTPWVARSRVLVHGIHRPLSRVLLRLERRVLREVDVVALSSNGAASMRSLRLGASVTESRLLLPSRAPIAPAASRPLAVGLYGHVYGGKGFDALREIRAALPESIALRVAGRGTSELGRIDGVEVLGEVNGDEESAFFASIRLLLMPYDKQPMGGVLPQPASATQLVAAAYATPCLALHTARLPDLASAGGCRIVEGGPSALAAEAGRLVNSPLDLSEMSREITAFREHQSASDSIAPYLALWARA